MRKKRSIKIDLAIGVVILFIVSAISPLTTGLNVETVGIDVELERMFDDLRFMCTEPSGFNSIKFEYYKEKILNRDSSDSSNDEVVVESEKRELVITIEPQLSLIVSNGGPMKSPWPMKCHDNRHTSQSTYSTVDTYAEKWRFWEDHWIEVGCPIDNEGIIYFGDIWGDVIALYPDGTLKWKYTLNGQILGSSPAIAEDGTIYFGTLWSLGDGGKIHAVNPNGTEKWWFQTEYSVSSAPAIGDDGTIYIGSNDNFLYAMNPDGTLKWKFKTGDYIKGSPSIADDGIVYIGSWDDYLYALYPNNGTMKWKCKIGQGTETNPAIADDGTIYVGSYDGHLYAVYPNGTLKWSFGVIGDIHMSCPAISADGTIYFGTDDAGYIYAVNPDGAEKWRKKIADKWVQSSPSIADDGTVYIGSSQDIGGYLHAFGPQESNDPPNKPSITGPSEGKVGTKYDFTFKATDPDRNPVSYYVEWGDGETTGWTDDYNTGEKITLSHSWSKKGNYTIQAKAKDTFGLESDWATFDIGIIKKNKAMSRNMFLLIILERFPLLQKLLQQLQFGL